MTIIMQLNGQSLLLYNSMHRVIIRSYSLHVVEDYRAAGIRTGLGKQCHSERRHRE